jgi:hypothetical protein
VPRVVQWHRPEAQHTPCPFPHPPHTGRPLHPPIHQLSIYLHSPPRLYWHSDGLRKHTHDGDAGRWIRRGQITRPSYAAPCSTVRTHTDDRPLPRPAATPSHHMQVTGLCVCVSAPVFLWLTTKGHAKLLHYCCTPTTQAPLAFAYTCMAVEWQSTRQVAPPAGCMHMPPTVCPLLEPTDRHAGQAQA